MSFFSSPSAAQNASPEPERQPYQRPDPAFGPPDDELGSLLPVTRFLARTDTAALVIRSVTAYEGGCLFAIGWAARRAQETASEWELTTSSMYHRRDFGQDAEDFTGLRFGVILSDGAVAVTHPRLGYAAAEVEGAVVFHLRPGGASGGPERLSGDAELWLHPIPPAGELTLIAEWKELGIGEARTTLDASAIREASLRTEQFWNEEL